MNNGKDEHENTQETQKPPEQTEATPSTPTSPNFTPTQELTQTQSKTQWRCPCMLPTEEGGAKQCTATFTANYNDTGPSQKGNYLKHFFT